MAVCDRAGHRAEIVWPRTPYGHRKLLMNVLEPQAFGCASLTCATSTPYGPFLAEVGPAAS